MSYRQVLVAGFISAAVFVSNALAYPHDITSPSHNLFTPELKPAPHSFQTARSTFLPETYEDLGLSEFKRSKYDYNQGDTCSAYLLTSCPANGRCSICPFNAKKFRLVSCNTGFSKTDNACIPNSCAAANASYTDTIPADYICSKILTYNLTCYHNCRPVNCNDYPLSCSATVPNSVSLIPCPDCSEATAKCSVSKCKISKCLDGYKVSENGRECIPLDDTCPNGYYKDCQTGTTGEPQFTEKGTACYKCQARTCANGSYNLNIYWCNGALKCLLPAN